MLIDMPKKDNEEEPADGVWAVYTAEAHSYTDPYVRIEEKKEEKPWGLFPAVWRAIMVIPVVLQLVRTLPVYTNQETVQYSSQWR